MEKRVAKHNKYQSVNQLTYGRPAFTAGFQPL